MIYQLVRLAKNINLRPTVAGEIFNSQALVAVTGLCLATVVGIFVGAGISLPALTLTLAFFAPIAFYFVISQYGCRFDWMLWLFIGAIFLASFASAITRQNLSFVSTAILFACFPLIVVSGLKIGGRWLLLSLIIVGFYFFGIVSSVLGRSTLVAGIYSGVIAVKPFLLVGIGSIFLWSDKTQHHFRLFLRWIWLLLLLAVLLQWFAPGLYSALLGGAEARPEPHPWFPGYPRGSGAFSQSSTLAAIAASLGLVALIDYLFLKDRRQLLACVVYFSLVVVSGQRQELLALAVVTPLVLIMFFWRPSLLGLLTALGVAGLTSLSVIDFVAPEMILEELQNWGFGNAISGKESARSILYSDSFDIANEYWPLGSGFGTFGSIGSVRFDRSFYFELGYSSFWWFENRSFLMDAYWSKYIAETGWLGFVLHLSFYLVIFYRLFVWVRNQNVRSNPDLFRLCLTAFGGLGYVLATSPTAFSLTEVSGGLLPLLFVGVAWQRVVGFTLQSRSV